MTIDNKNGGPLAATMVHRPLPHAGLLSGASLFLDFDGTLVEIAHRPDAVEVSAELRRLLGDLSALLHGRMALVSGRGAEDIAARVGLAGLAIAGSHGLERRLSDGRTETRRRAPAIDRAAAAMDSLARDWPGVLVERKPLGCALHYRGAPDAADACHALALGLGKRHALAVQPGKMVVELRQPGADKGGAVTAFMAEAPFAGTRPVFIGDDVTDEAGFAAAAALGGVGILVGAERESLAAYRLPDVATTHAWLAAQLDSAG